MTAPVPGWYADPNGGNSLRWWDGTTWSESTQPAPAPAFASGQAGTPGYPAGPTPGYPVATPTPAARPSAVSLWSNSKNTLITIAVCVVYGVIATFTSYVFFGILPVLFTVRAFQAKEPLALVAAICAAAAIGYSLYTLSL